MELYGFEVHEGNTATLFLMRDVGKGNGNIGSRWACTPIKTGPKKEIMADCERLNDEVAKSLA